MGYYYLKSRLGYYLDVSGGGTGNGTNIQVHQQNWSTTQKFWLSPTKPYAKITEGSYTILTALNTSKAVDVSGGGYANGTNIQLCDVNNS